MSSSHSVDVDSVVGALDRPATLADGTYTVQALIDLSQREDWPAPAREAAIYTFTKSLATHPSHSVNPDILEYLSTYQAQVLVAGEHGDTQPLFNIRAAAAGVENSWLRDDSKQLALNDLRDGPEKWLAMYNSAQHPAQRSGYLDALKLADTNTVQLVQALTLQQLGEHPEMTAVIAATLSMVYDQSSAREFLQHAKGAELAPALAQLSTSASQQELTALLEFAITQTATETAALAIASWGPILNSRAESRQLLLDTLADPELGSSAALSLANKPNIQTIRELQLLSEGLGLAARRAQLALQINRESVIQEQRQ